jgi:hypothetical protein
MTRIESITVAPTTEKKTVPGRFEAALQGAARGVAATVIGAAEVAIPALPFGNVIAGAVRGATGGVPFSGRVLTGGAAALPPGATTGTAATGATGAISAAGGQGDLLEATRAMQVEAQAMNLQYLQLQERMQQESREFTALSNVMKVKHDSARAAIANIH